jgi:hypothetical protein
MKMGGFFLSTWQDLSQGLILSLFYTYPLWYVTVEQHQRGAKHIEEEERG